MNSSLRFCVFPASLGLFVSSTRAQVVLYRLEPETAEQFGDFGFLSPARPI
jgi:hypothetical protein